MSAIESLTSESPQSRLARQPPEVWEEFLSGFTEREKAALEYQVAGLAGAAQPVDAAGPLVRMADPCGTRLWEDAGGGRVGARAGGVRRRAANRAGGGNRERGAECDGGGGERDTGGESAVVSAAV